MKKNERAYITDCEGPISKNDNAFELTRHFISQGAKLFNQISRYDDVLADIVKRKGYKAGDTLKLIAPFLKAYGVTDEKISRFSTKNILLMPGAKATLRFLKELMPSFIVSTSYQQYIRALCIVLDFPFKRTHCTLLNIDSYQVGREERQVLKEFKQEICAMPLIQIPGNAKSVSDLSERDQETIIRLDEIFFEEMLQLESKIMFEEINPVGGTEKAKVTTDIVDEIGIDLSSVIYIGDSITDVECFKLVKEKGGATISFNGNAYAVREAEIAVLSKNALAIAALADAFRRHGKAYLLKLVESWRCTCLAQFDVDPLLRKMIRAAFPKKLPKVSEITNRNMFELAAESSAFRKCVRGENVGMLG